MRRILLFNSLHRQPLLRTLIVTTAVLLFGGCSKETPERRPAGSNDVRISEAAPVLEEWTRLWQAAIPGFRPESLIAAGTGSALRGGYVQPLKNVYPPPTDDAGAFQVLSADSPDGRYKLVFDWYQSVDEEDGEISIGGEPDSAPLLLDLRDGISNQFESCGTPCGFDWGAWISPTRFVLGTWYEADSDRARYEGGLRIYSIRDSTVALYRTRPVSSEAYSRYRSAWQAWVANRYRGLKRQALR